jgi:hypothetical protein
MKNTTRNYINDGCDYFGKKLSVGMTVIKPAGSAINPLIDVRIITGISGDDVWHTAPNSNRNIKCKYSGRLVIINKPTLLQRLFSRF